MALSDQNTKYFHTKTIIRRREDRIEMLKNDKDNWVSNSQELENLAVSYYKRLYSMEFWNGFRQDLRGGEATFLVLRDE